MKIRRLSQVWWLVPVLLALEAEAGGLLQVGGKPELYRQRHCLKIKTKVLVTATLRDLCEEARVRVSYCFKYEGP